LSVPRFDLAGVGFDISGTGKQQALFAGGTCPTPKNVLFFCMNFMAPTGTTADKKASDVVDSFLFGSAIPDVYDSSIFLSPISTIKGFISDTRFKCRSRARGRSSASWATATPSSPPAAHVSSISRSTPMIQVPKCRSFAAAQQTSTSLICRAPPPSPLPPKHTAPICRSSRRRLATFSRHAPFLQPKFCFVFATEILRDVTRVQLGSNCGVCDLSSASMDGWFMMAGGQWSLNASDPDKVRRVHMHRRRSSGSPCVCDQFVTSIHFALCGEQAAHEVLLPLLRSNCLCLQSMPCSTAPPPPSFATAARSHFVPQIHTPA
jgi:hypothetical protein